MNVFRVCLKLLLNSAGCLVLMGSMAQAQVATELELSKGLKALTADFSLLEAQLEQAVQSENMPIIQQLLPVYRGDLRHQLWLVAEAEVALLRIRGESKSAIARYRRLLADNPTDLNTRMILALLLFWDKQNTAAQDQLLRLRSDKTVSSVSLSKIDAYLMAIYQRAALSLGAGANYYLDNKINKLYSSPVVRLGEGQLLAEEGGVNLAVGVGKAIHLVGEHYLPIDFRIGGKISPKQWLAHDVSGRFSLGYQYQNAHSRFSFLPFYRQRLILGQPYSHSYGLAFEFAHWLNPNWQWSNYHELAYERENQSNSEIERQLYHRFNVLWQNNPYRSLIMGVSAYDVAHRQVSLAYFQTSASLTWQEDWEVKGLSSQLTMNYGEKRYKANANDARDVEQRWGASLSLWHRNYHWWGITPKLSATFQQSVNQARDSSPNNQVSVLIELGKTF